MTAAPACNIRDRSEPSFDVDSLNLRACHTVEINTALNEFERQAATLSHRWETWPLEVQRRITDELKKWQERDKSRVVRLVSTGLHQGVAVLILHYEKK